MAKMFKMALMAIMEWYDMATNMAVIGVYWKSGEKGRSPMKTELKKLHQVKSYSQIKIDSEIMAISFVFLPHFGTK